MFDRIAPKYDLLNHTLSVGIDKIWRRRVVNIVKRYQPRRILDMATGTGDLAIALARRIPEAYIVGADPSEGMLTEARKKVADLGLSDRIRFRTTYAEAISSQDEPLFDVVTVAFGVRNFEDMARGLRQLRESLRPGGKLVILEFSNPTHPLIKGIYRWYSHAILPRIGGMVSKDVKAYEYLPASVDEFPSPDCFTALLDSLGFSPEKPLSQSFGIAQIYRAEKR